MAMNVLQSPSRPGLGKVSCFFWRNPGLGLFLLLLGPLMWFGIVYFGSLLTLLWQGFYTFDDFTMSVTPELTLANIRALFNPANYDIILRTLTMAVAVTIASAILAFPMVPVTNVVALLVMLVTTLPILGAWWLTREGDNGQ